MYEHEYITFKESLLILKDPNMHPLLQSAYLDFVISALVDFNVKESGVDIDNIWHSYVSNIRLQINGTDALLSFSGLE